MHMYGILIYIYHHYNIDILNCMINDHNCSQLCVEVEGSFNCSCYPGYELQQNRVTCTGNQIRINTWMHTSNAHISTYVTRSKKTGLIYAKYNYDIYLFLCVLFILNSVGISTYKIIFY